MKIHLSLAAALLLMLPQATFAAGPVVSLGPEQNVSSSAGLNPALNEYQTDLRCNPADPLQRLITCKVGSDEKQTIALATIDGGKTWTASPVLAHSGDPDGVYAQDGRALWSFINTQPKSLGVRTSTTTGATWGDTIIADVTEIDHPQMICDRGTGKFGGSIYIAGRPMSTGGYDVVCSRDHGATFATTHLAYQGDLNKGFVEKPAVLANGTLVIPIMGAAKILAKDGNYAGSERKLYCLRSHDGGVTFDPPIVITPWNGPAKTIAGGAAETGGFAVGTWQGRERIYLTFAQGLETEPDALMMTTSDDGGTTWTKPRAIVPPALPGWGAGSSSIMVNSTGIVGIQYYSLESGHDFDVFFTASTDGGATFSKPVRLSTATSNQPLTEPRWAGQDQVYGDTDAKGVFHLVWTDARNHATAYQVYTRSVTVTLPVQ